MNKRKTGGAHEKQAADYLKAQGFTILEMNYRCRFGEVDIIAREGVYLSIVEVKYRATDRRGSPLEAVTLPKQRKIAGVLNHYLITHPWTEKLQVRFDVVGILGEEITLLRNAFPYPG